MKKRIAIPSMPKTFPVTCHTDYVGKGSIFVAIDGFSENGINYIPLALEKGASKIIVQVGTTLPGDVQEKIKLHHASIDFVENTRKALATLSAQAAGSPAKKLKIIGVTGTKGKTTTTYLIEHILKESGLKTARISSGSSAIDNTSIKTPLTTPPADYLQQFLAQCVNHHVEWVVIEIAAHALALERIREITLDSIIFTNFEREHLEFFKSIQDYYQIKLQIFNYLKPKGLAFVNGNDNWCKKALTLYSNIQTFGLDNKECQIAGNLDEGWEYRLSLTISFNKKNYKLLCPHLQGRFNAYNVIAAIGITLSLGISIETIAAALYSFVGVPGRQDYYKLPNGATAIVDFAHTPSSYEAILSLLRLRTHNLIVVFGHGGQRDKGKRPLLGAVAAKYADLIILTSDNPRSENPQEIIKDIAQGIPENKKTSILTAIKRTDAIKAAYKCSQRGSIIAILGKGSEEIQIIGTQQIPYSDKETLLSL